MHFWRGLAEFVAVLCSAEYIHTLYYDRNTVQIMLYKQFGIFSSNSYILKEIRGKCEELANQLTEEQEEEQEEVMDEMRDEVEMM